MTDHLDVRYLLSRLSDYLYLPTIGAADAKVPKTKRPSIVARAYVQHVTLSTVCMCILIMIHVTCVCLIP